MAGRRVGSQPNRTMTASYEARKGREGEYRTTSAARPLCAVAVALRLRLALVSPPRWKRKSMGLVGWSVACWKLEFACQGTQRVSKICF